MIYAWLVENFTPEGQSTGLYMACQVNMTLTADVNAARKFRRQRTAEFRAADMREARRGDWRAVEHGFDDSKTPNRRIEPMPAPHVHADVAIEFFKDPSRVVQYQNPGTTGWADHPAYVPPVFYPEVKYRLKPKAATLRYRVAVISVNQKDHYLCTCTLPESMVSERPTSAASSSGPTRSKRWRSNADQDREPERSTSMNLTSRWSVKCPMCGAMPGVLCQGANRPASPFTLNVGSAS